MTLNVRKVTLSNGAEEILRNLAAGEDLPPDVLASLLLELAIRERHDWISRFSVAAAAVDERSRR